MRLYKQKALMPRVCVPFNPANSKHRLDYASFVKYGNWKNGCSYGLEYPYMDVPTMINAKIVDHALAPLMSKV
jgi:hypothetical protein